MRRPSVTSRLVAGSPWGERRSPPPEAPPGPAPPPGATTPAALQQQRDELLAREHAARREAEQARERLDFLASASAALTASLDARSSAVTLTRLAVPALCEWCSVQSLDEDGCLRPLALAHATSDGLELAQRVRDKLAAPDATWSVRRFIERGEAVLVERITDDQLAAVAPDEECLSLLRRLDPTSAVLAPLFARGRVQGHVSLVRTGASAPFAADDLALVENLAVRAAMAIDNGRLFDERSRIARILQQALLPATLPQIPGVEVSARYRTAEAGVDVGGDFYDVFEQPGGSWTVVIGDVSGKGALAAAITGLVRHTIRAVAESGRAPSEVLRRTNDVLLGQVEDTRFCTAALLQLVPEGSGAHVAVASGGHPQPYVVRAGGGVEAIGLPGSLLGALPDPQYTDQQVRLGAGDAIVLYTDGITEARVGQEQFGDRRLSEVLAALAGRSAGEVADGLTRAVWEFQSGVLADDTAVVVVRAVGAVSP